MRRAVTLVALGLAGLGYVVATFELARRDQLWNDELFTYYFARLPDLGAVWDQLSTGVEQTPPVYYVITRTALRIAGSSDVALRLPGLIGVLAACACLYAFVARRSSATYGFIAALIVLCSQATFYAHEARPYGLVLGGAAAALLCWQLRGEPSRSTVAVVGMTLFLGVAVACHYYAALLVVPFALGEAVRTATRRRLDLPVFAGLAVALTPLVVAVPLIRAARTYSGAFWADFGWRSAVEFNGWLFETVTVPSGPGTRPEVALFIWLLVGLALHALLAPMAQADDSSDGSDERRPFGRLNGALLVGAGSVLVGALAVRYLAGERLPDDRLRLVCAATLVVLAYAALRHRRNGITGVVDSRRVSPPEIVAASGFLLLPVLAVAVATIVTGAYTERYVLPATVGVAILLPLALHRLDSGRRLVSICLAIVLLFVVGLVYWNQATEVRDENRERNALIRSLERTAGARPVVVADPHQFFELSHYAPPALAGRLIHLAGQDAALRYTDSYSTEAGLEVLSRFAPLDVRRFERFVASGDPFLLLLRPDRDTWVVPALEAAGRTLRPYPARNGLSLYVVRRPQHADAPSPASQP